MYENHGPVKFERLSIKIVPEESSRMAAMMSGEFDYTAAFPLTFIAQAKDAPMLEVQQAVPNFQLAYYGFKITRPMVSDRRVRQAMSIAINRAEIAQGVFFGYARPAFTYVDPGALDYDPEAAGVVKEDVVLAGRLLDEAGWKLGADGIREKDGVKLTPKVYLVAVPLAQKFAEAMQANASYSTTLAMKMPKMVQRDFEPHFSVKHMLKDMQIANQLGLLHYLDLGVSAAARDRLIEQIQLGHGDDDFSAVARKYLREAALVSNEQSQIEDQDEHANSVAGAPAPDSAPASADLEKTRRELEHVAANAHEETMLPGEETKIAARLRQGFLSQLVHRGKQLLRQPFSSREG